MTGCALNPQTLISVFNNQLLVFFCLVFSCFLLDNKKNTLAALSKFPPSHRMLQIQVHMESSHLMSRQSGAEACLSSSTMMLASRPSDCQCVDFSGPSSYLSRKNRGWLRATVWNIWTRGEEDTQDYLLTLL